VLELIISVA